MIAHLALALSLTFGAFAAHAADPSLEPSARMSPPAISGYPTQPMAGPDGRRWRIGYVESGDYAEYPQMLAAIVESLQDRGWLELKGQIPEDLDGRALWTWLARHTDSTTLEFVEDAWWQPGNFDTTLREPMRAAILERIRNQGDLDLMLAMGTWAGQDMRAIGPPIPTEVTAVSDALASGIANSAQDSGRDLLHARIEPGRYQRQLRLFHEIAPFKRLGIVYEDSAEGRSYAALDAVNAVSAELDFTIEPCLAPSSNIPLEQAIAHATGCYQTLADAGVDAVYITIHRGVTPQSIKTVADILMDSDIPSFSMVGSSEVRKGVLLSLAQADLSYAGDFHAQAIARIFHGAMPRDLNQIAIDPQKIALNLVTARAIGFDPPVDILLAADEVYETQ